MIKNRWQYILTGKMLCVHLCIPEEVGRNRRADDLLQYGDGRNKTVQNVYVYEELDRWFWELIGKYEKWARYQIRWKEKRNASIKEVEFPFA